MKVRVSWVGWTVVAALVLAATITGVDKATEAATSRPAAATSSLPKVAAAFYSGKGCAGLTQASGAVRRLRDSSLPCLPGPNGGLYDGRWSIGNCDPSHTTFPATINGQTVTQLAGYSLGRLGPIYLLRASSSLAANITSILMIDPGSSEILTTYCDNATATGATGYLGRWLGRSPSNRLIIMAGQDTAASNYAGINQVYFGGLNASVRRAQVFVCYANLNHDEMMTTFGPQLIGRAVSSCPDGYNRVDNPPAPPPPGGSGGNPGGGGPTSEGSNPGGGGGGSPATYGSINIGSSTAHPNWISMALNGFSSGSFQYTCNFGSGGAQTYTVSVTSSSVTYDNGHTCYDTIPGDSVWVTIGPARSNTLTVPSSSGGGGGSGSGSGPTTPAPPPGPASINIGWSSAHPAWITMTLSGFASGSYQYTCNFGSGGPHTYTVGVTSSPETFDNGQTCYDGIAGDTVQVTIGSTTSDTITVPGSAPPPPPPPATYSETVGGATNTWTNPSNAGGSQGQTIANGQTVQVSCYVVGFRVSDGDTYWYRIAQSPWNNNYFASADAFYNNGATSGSLHGTPFVDPAVPAC